MTNLNPADYKNGQPIAALEVGETVSSESPKVTLGKSKGVIAAIGGVVTSVGVLLPSVLSDGAVSLNEGILLVLAVLAGLGVPVIGTYLVPTTVTGASKRG